MKRLFFIWLAVVFTGVCCNLNAQEKLETSDKALSAQFKFEISVLNAEIKALKLKSKGDQKNLELRSELVSKQEELKDVKSKKKIIDDAIKSKAASEKATIKAEKAAIKAQKHAEDAKKLREKEKI